MSQIQNWMRMDIYDRIKHPSTVTDFKVSFLITETETYLRHYC